MFKLRKRMVFTIAFTLFTASLFADVYLKQRMLQPDAKDKKDAEQIHETWITPTKVRTNTGDHSSIFDVEKNLLINLDHSKKKYMEIPLDFSSAVAADPQAENLPAFMKNMMKMEVSIRPTGEEKQIGEWACRKYLQTLKMAMMTSESEIWASEDIHVDIEVYRKFSAALMASQPGFYKLLGDMMKESEKIRGIPVLQITKSKVMGKTMETTTELIEVKDVETPADLFVVPPGYKKEKFKAE